MSKSGPKSGSKPVRFPTVIHKVACFWTVFSKTFICGLSNLHCSVPCVTRTYPQYRNSRKSVTDKQTNRQTNKQTNGTSSFWLSHERKGASRNDALCFRGVGRSRGARMERKTPEMNVSRAVGILSTRTCPLTLTELRERASYNFLKWWLFCSLSHDFGDSPNQVTDNSYC